MGVAVENPDPGQVEITVGRMLEQGHYSRRKLDDRVSAQLLKNYLEALDYNHLYFTQGDVDKFVAEHAKTLDDDILLGRTDAAHEIYAVYKKRVEDRMAWAKGLIKQEFAFSGDQSIEVNRQKSSWPKDAADADRLWRDRIEGELLQETLNKHKVDPPAKILGRRYDQLLRYLREQTKEDELKIFLSVLSQTYDPHSEYMSRSELETFSINMRLSLVGIGAVLTSDDGYAKIQEIVTGGPASKDGRLKVGDRVAAVAQGDKEFVDAVDMKLDKVVEMIRGQKDSLVRLQVIPSGATDPSDRKVIEIRRDEIKLKEQEAKAELVEHVLPGGGTQKLGWITLPSFYADMERSGAANAKSTTKDVLALLNRLKKEGIQGLVVDLRRNGGGSLEEAVNLTGLFIKKGPVVQARDSNGSFHVSKDRDPMVAYDGPLVVLTNRLSASASEIFAAALQDYQRALVVGDSSTFGKGTVQTMLEMGRMVPMLGNGAGALKLTIQKFYRVAGGSTQLKGVEPDIRVPSPFDMPEIGEAALKGPLAYDTVEPVDFEKCDKPLFKGELRDRCLARVATNPEFAYIAEDLERQKKRVEENRLSLNLEKRKSELEEKKMRDEARKAERAQRKLVEPKRYSVTLDSVDKPELELASNVLKKKQEPIQSGASGDKAEPAEKTKKPEADKPGAGEDSEDDLDEDAKPVVDAVRDEALNILSDFTQMSNAASVAGSSGAGAAASGKERGKLGIFGF
jgi:carboxyl-terminal processing protease